MMSLVARLNSMLGNPVHCKSSTLLDCAKNYNEVSCYAAALWCYVNFLPWEYGSVVLRPMATALPICFNAVYH